MSSLSKRSTIYFDPTLHNALKIKSASSLQSVSEIVDEAIRLLMLEDQDDLKSYNERKDESEITYEALLNKLKKNGQI